MRERKATKIISKDNWIPEQEKILKKPNEYEAGVLNALNSAVVSLCLQALKKKDLLYYTNFHFKLISTNNYSTTHTHTHTRASAHVSDLTVIALQNCLH